MDSSTQKAFKHGREAGGGLGGSQLDVGEGRSPSPSTGSPVTGGLRALLPPQAGSPEHRDLSCPALSPVPGVRLTQHSCCEGSRICPEGPQRHGLETQPRQTLDVTPARPLTSLICFLAGKQDNDPTPSEINSVQCPPSTNGSLAHHH